MHNPGSLKTGFFRGKPAEGHFRQTTGGDYRGKFDLPRFGAKPFVAPLHVILNPFILPSHG
jgi:hypothetical protein